MNSIKLIRPLLALSVLIFASLACALGGPPAIGEVVIAKSLDADYKPVNPTSKYTSDDTVISISVEVQNLIIGSAVEVKYQVDGVATDNLKTVADEEGSGYYGFTFTFENGIIPGDYVTDVYLDGKLVKTVSFKVEPSGPPTIKAVVVAKSLDDSYKPVDSTSTFSPSDTFYISVQVKDLIIGSNVVVKYYFEDENIPDLDTSLVADKVGSGYYGFSLQAPPDGFPAGNYKAEVYLDDKLSETVTFSIP